MNEEAYKILLQHNVTRLCHFTKLVNCIHIINDGIQPTDHISNDLLRVTDANRFDNDLSSVCCTIQFPNPFYLNTVIKRDKDQIFRIWCVILIDPRIILQYDVTFYPGNASIKRGKCGSNDVKKLFCDTVFDGKHIVKRSKYMPICCPTNLQAEVHIHGIISEDYIIGYMVASSDVAKLLNSDIQTLNKRSLPIWICEGLQDLSSYASFISNNGYPIEQLWEDENNDH